MIIICISIEQLNLLSSSTVSLRDIIVVAKGLMKDSIFWSENRGVFSKLHRCKFIQFFKLPIGHFDHFGGFSIDEA